MAPRQEINFNTINIFANQHQNQQQSLPQIQQSPYYVPQTASSTAHQTAINTPLLQSIVRPGFQP